MLYTLSGEGYTMLQFDKNEKYIIRITNENNIFFFDLYLKFYPCL